MNDPREGKWLSSHLLVIPDWQGGFRQRISSFQPSATFAFSLPEERDLLSQWGYANGGRGIATGFDPALLRNACQPVSDWKELAGSPRITFCKVEYKNSEQMNDIAKEIAEDIKRLEGEWDTFFEQFKPKPTDSTYANRDRQFTAIGSGIRNAIGYLDPVLKNKAFHQENDLELTRQRTRQRKPSTAPL